LNPSKPFWRFYGDFVNPAFKTAWPDDDYYVQGGLPAVGEGPKCTHVPSHSFVKVLITQTQSKLMWILSLLHYSNKHCFTISLVAFKFWSELQGFRFVSPELLSLWVGLGMRLACKQTTWLSGSFPTSASEMKKQVSKHEWAAHKCDAQKIYYMSIICNFVCIGLPRTATVWVAGCCATRCSVVRTNMQRRVHQKCPPNRHKAWHHAGASQMPSTLARGCWGATALLTSYPMLNTWVH